ncbi:MAG TPA: LysM peptidoglycan-binding domain-containing protein [Spirochaetota bacterium]|nr:LysM peptidoglycan-binding domain-containing protein [Spirochaetota bacterium]HPF07508.1 LysM peptidoglycan-binding domain-containing protein [Spirochaetota bacterium]HPJ40730.1 LysM peptidoglycan-binding domain-containing protein [Spirochaetota bacterium]HPR35999.1 LysM peptidoglycan-binding domain-containing protein [Spirochaetota bacterium]HRX45913.1 LysM peptidoglycan-binding domain-containing protein [Spirochaetota bacterium]
MSSYYRTINGKHYDRAMLDMADNSVNKKRDAIISLADARKIIGKASDAGKITEIEARTLNYIFEHYKFTKSAEDFFSNFANLEKNEHVILEEGGPAADDDIFGFKEFMAKYYLYFIIIALILFLLYLYSDRLTALFTGTAKINEPVKVEQTAEQTKETDRQQENVSVTAGENEYIVQPKDTLFDISSRLYGDPSKWKELYDRNKDIIEKPEFITPGQKLKTDITR